MCKSLIIEKLIITECMAGYYGKECLKQCSTSCSSSCDRISGHCDDGCKLGWAGNACDKKISIYISHSDCVDCCHTKCSVKIVWYNIYLIIVAIR